MLGLIPLPYRILAVVVLWLATGAVGYWRGYVAADRTATIEAMAKDMARTQAEAAEWLRQAAAAKAAATAAAERQAKAEADNAAMQTEIEDYAKALAALPDCGCALTDDDVRRLRGIGATPRRDAPHPAPGPLILRPGHGSHPAGGR